MLPHPNIRFRLRQNARFHRSATGFENFSVVPKRPATLRSKTIASGAAILRTSEPPAAYGHSYRSKRFRVLD
jgi:hypothetical protein